MPSSADIAYVPIATTKQRRPSTKATGDVTQPSKRPKKTARKGDHEIFVISSQDTGVTTSEVTHYLLIGEVSMGTQPNSPASTSDQMTIVKPMAQPANLVNQPTQNTAIEELVV